MATLQEIMMLRNQPSPLAQLGEVVSDVYGTYKRKEKEQAALEKGEAAKLEAFKLLSQSEKAQDPAQREQLFMQAYAASPELVGGIIEAQKTRREGMGGGGSPKPFQQGDGGLVFDPNTGQYKVDETAKRVLTKKAEQKAAEGAKLTAKDIQGINKDVTGLIKDTVGIDAAAKSLEGLKQSSSPSAQLAAIFKFMKALDPTSVVREGEQQMARATGGPADFMVGIVNDLQGEGGLPPAVFADMVATSRNLADSAINTSRTEISDYLDVYGNTIPEDFKSKIKSRIPKAKSTKGEATNKVVAPKAAIDFLMANPSSKAAFKQKYGYLPEGV